MVVHLVDRKSHILIVINSLNMGGPQKSLVALLRRIDPIQFDLSLLVLNPRKDELRGFIPEHVKVLETPPLLTAAVLPRENWGLALWRLLCLLPGMERIRLLRIMVSGLLKRTPGQQVRQRVWSLSSPFLPSVPGTYDAGVGILGLSTYAVVDLVNARHKYHWVRSDSRMLNRDEQIEAAYFRNLSGALAVSTQCGQIYEEMYVDMRGRVRVYKNDLLLTLPGADERTAPLEKSGGVLKVLTIARLDPLKGIDLAVNACAILKAQGLRVNWIVLGDGPSKKELETAIYEKGLTTSFTLPGTVYEVGGFLADADIYVHPSRVEGRSNAVEEARAAGKPIIATNYSTVTDQVENGVDGLVCGIDEISLANSIKMLANDLELQRRIGSEAKRRYFSERDNPNELFGALVDGSFGQS